MITSCIISISSYFYKHNLLDNPFNSPKYLPSQWHEYQHVYLISLALNQRSLKTNWHQWCADPNLSSDYLTEGEEHWPMRLWKSVSYFCIRSLSDEMSGIMFNYFNPIPDLASYSSEISSARSRVSHFFKRILPSSAPTIEEIQFSSEQILKIFSVLLYRINYAPNSTLSVLSGGLLQDYLLSLKYNHRRLFPMRRELKNFIREFLSFRYNLQTTDGYNRICTLLVKLMQFCADFEARGTWLLNVFVIWVYVRGDNDTLQDQFLQDFFKIFFSSRAHVTGPDVCALLNFVRETISDPSDYRLLIEVVSLRYLVDRPDLSTEILRSCPQEFPRKLITNSRVFPLKPRLETLLKGSRVVEALAPSLIVRRKRHDERSLYSTLVALNTRFEDSDSKYVCLNSCIIVYNDRGMIREFLNGLYNKLLMYSGWFSESSQLNDNRSLLLPLPFLPPQLMDAIGYLLGMSAVTNVPIPFVLDKDYFEMISAPNPSSPVLDVIYPYLLNFASDRSVFRAIACKDQPALLLLKGMCFRTLKLYELIDEPEHVVNSLSQMKELITQGMKNLKIGINRALPGVDTITTSQLHYLIFTTNKK